MAAKPATLVKPGDQVEARIGERLRVLEVTGLIEKRAGAAIAAACYLDHSPPPPTREEAGSPNFAREQGYGASDQAGAPPARPGAPSVGRSGGRGARRG